MVVIVKRERNRFNIYFKRRTIQISWGSQCEVQVNSSLVGAMHADRIQRRKTRMVLRWGKRERWSRFENC